MPSGKYALTGVYDDDDDSQDDASLYSSSDSDTTTPTHGRAARGGGGGAPRAGARPVAAAAGGTRQGRARSPRGPSALPRDARGKLRSKSPASGRDSPLGTPRGNAPEKFEEDNDSGYFDRSVAFVGPSGAGKTTALGFFLCVMESGKDVPLAATEASAKDAGRPLAKYAWVLDRTVEEREYGTAAPREVRIQVVPKRSAYYCDIHATDCPGGSTAEVEASLRVMLNTGGCVVVVSAIPEEFEEGVSYLTLLLRGAAALQMKPDTFTYLVNKMDAVEYSMDAFNAIVKRLNAIVEEVTGVEKLSEDRVASMAAAVGTNMVRAPDWPTKMSKHCAAQCIEEVNMTNGFLYNFPPTAFVVEEVVQPDVVNGVGATALIMRVLPSGATVELKAIRNPKTGGLRKRTAIGLNQISFTSPCPDIVPGCLLVSGNAPSTSQVSATSGFECFNKAKVQFTTLGLQKSAITPETAVTMRVHNFTARVRLLVITRVRGPKGNWSTGGSGKSVGSQTEAEAVIESLDGPIPFYCSRICVPYDRQNPFNRFNRMFLYVNDQFVGAGVILENLDKKESDDNASP